MIYPYSPDKEYMDNFCEWYRKFYSLPKSATLPFKGDKGFIVVMHDHKKFKRYVIIMCGKIEATDIYRELTPTSFERVKTYWEEKPSNIPPYR